MSRFVLIVLGLILIQNITFSQGIRDSVFKIKTVEIVADRIFKKEEAGMKKTTVDSLVMMEKINLSLSELLSENTPIFIKSHGRGALASASFRGTAASHTQVTWNGININSPMAGMVDFSLIPVYIIDDLNLKHGAASISDQSGGLGGSISINNTVDWNNKFSLKALQGIGSYNTFDEFISISGGNKKFQSKTRAYHNYSKNNYTFINRGIANINQQTGAITNPLDTNDNADFRKYGLMQEFYFCPNAKNIFSAKYWGQSAKRTIPRATSYEGPDNSNLNRQVDIDHKAVFDWNFYAKKSKTTILSGYSQKQLDYSLHNHVPGVGPTPAIYSESMQRSLLNSAVFQYNINDKLSVEAKVNLNFHDVVSSDSVKKTGYKEKQNELSGFFSVRKNFINKVNANLMIRQEIINSKIVPLVPYFGFDWKVFESKDFFIKGNIAKNYHSPSLNDLYWQPGGNPDLKQEEGASYEFGLEYYKKNKNVLFHSGITAYRSDINNWIIWIPSFKGYWEPRNIKRVLSQGVEIDASIKGIFKQISFNISGNYAYTKSTNYGNPIVWGDESYGKQLVYIPLHSGNLLVNLKYKGFYITFQHNSYSERFTTSSNDVSRRDWLYPYFMNDIIFGKEFYIKKINITTEFKIYNLLNETYHSVLYRPMPKQNYILLLMLNF